MRSGVKKVCLIGSARVGKSTYAQMLRYPHPEISSKYIPTIGVDVMQVSIDGSRIALWDLAGDERYGAYREGYLMGADVIFVAAKSMQEYERSLHQYSHMLAHTSCIIKPLILSPDHVNIHDRESCMKPMRDILA